MRPALVVVFTLSTAVAGFLAGSAYQSHITGPEARLEDYALQNILGTLVIANRANKGDVKSIRSLADVQFNSHLKYVREFSGAISEPEFEEAKIRGLNALAVLWKEEPPFTGAEYTATPENESWLPEWKSIHAKNLQLLAWAQAQCESRPSIRCNRSGAK